MLRRKRRKRRRNLRRERPLCRQHRHSLRQTGFRERRMRQRPRTVPRPAPVLRDSQDSLRIPEPDAARTREEHREIGDMARDRRGIRTTETKIRTVPAVLAIPAMAETVPEIHRAAVTEDFRARETTAIRIEIRAREASREEIRGTECPAFPRRLWIPSPWKRRAG